MNYQDATAALFGYSPTGAFSIEVGKRNDNGTFLPFAEQFFVVGPGNVSHQYRFKISRKDTLDGASVSDFGNGSGLIRLSGSIYAFHEGPVIKPASFLGSVKKAIDIIGLQNKPGHHELFDLIYWMTWSRDKTAHYTVKPSYSAGDKQANGAFTMRLNLDGPSNHEDLMFVFNDHDTKRRYEIVTIQDGFSLEQSAGKYATWDWTINFDAIQELTTIIPKLTPPIPDPRGAVNRALNILRDLSFVVTGALAAAAEIVAVIDDVRGIKDELIVIGEAFNERAEDSIQSIRRTLGAGREAEEKASELIQKFYVPNQDLDIAYTSSYADNSEMALQPSFADLTKFQQAMNMMQTAVTAGVKVDAEDYVRTVDVPPAAKSWEDVALYYLQDVTRAGEIKQLNGTRAAMYKPFDYGRQIKIPSTSTAERDEAEYFGTDLALTERMGLKADSSGDLAGVSGLDAIVEHSLDRLMKPAGTIPLHLEWGVAPVPGSVPQEYVTAAASLKITQNLQQNRAVALAEITEMGIDGDAIQARVRVTPRSGAEAFTLSFKTRIRE